MVRLFTFIILASLQACFLMPSDEFNVSGGSLEELNSRGQLSNGVRFSKLDIAEDTSCAVSEEKDIWCWGKSIDSLINYPSLNSNHLNPQKINLGTHQGKVKDFALGFGIFCYITDDDSLYCHGVPETTFATYNSIGSFKHLKLGTRGGCAIYDDGTYEYVICFGWSRALLGNGVYGFSDDGYTHNDYFNLSYGLTGGVDDVMLDLQVEDQTACALVLNTTSGNKDLKCWGYTSFMGVVDDGSGFDNLSYSDNVDDLVSLASADHSNYSNVNDFLLSPGRLCYNNGSFNCKGMRYSAAVQEDNVKDNVGANLMTVEASPVGILGFGTFSLSNLFFEYSPLSYGDATQLCIGCGIDTYAKTGIDARTPTGHSTYYYNVFYNLPYTCKITSTKELACRGWSGGEFDGISPAVTNGRRLGDSGFGWNPGFKKLQMSETVGNDRVQQHALGKDHGCFISEDRFINCWGKNLEGQLGTGDTTGSSKPVPVNFYRANQ